MGPLDPPNVKVTRAVLTLAALASVSSARLLFGQGVTWSVADVPIVRIGTEELTNSLLVAPTGATRLPNGNFVVGDLDEFSIKEFSPKGEPLRKYGRKGSGPGEVSYMFPLLRCGDALVANDLGSGSLQSVFEVSGKFVKSFRLTPLPYRLACNAKMKFAVIGWETKGIRKEGAYRPMNPFYVAQPDSAPILIGEFPGAERIGNRPLPLGRDARMAIGATRVYVALGDSVSILVFDLNGKQITVFNARQPRVEATKDDLVAEMEREIARTGEKSRSRISREYSTMPLVKFLPATRDLVVDAEGNLWVQHFPRSSRATVTWTTFSLTGKVLATTQLPAGLEVYEIGRDYVLGRIVDAGSDLPEVRLFALVRR